MEVDIKDETREAEMDEVMDADGDAEEREPLPSDASETVYVKNLNESVKVDVLKQTLQSLFSLYGTVLSVKASSNVRMRGQAFISFDSKEPAAKAVKEVLGFPLYGKPVQISFARTQSDAVVSKKDGDAALESFKEQRKEHKRRQRAQWRRRLLAMKAGENEGRGTGEATAADSSAAAGGGAGAGRRQEMQMPDEYLPPNRILFLHNVPDSVGRDDLETLFRNAHQGLLDVRLIPGRGVAFVEFTDAMQSSAARDALNGHQFTPTTDKLRITFAK